MAKKCDNKSVGMLVWNEGNLLLIERKRPPYGFAPPAGHLDEDGDEYETSARRELWEEVGLTAKSLELKIEGRKENHCRREGGTHHYWKVYEVIASGKIKRNIDETKQVGWYSRDKLGEFAKRTEDYIAGNVSEIEWQSSPGIEPVWYELMKELSII